MVSTRAVGHKQGVHAGQEVNDNEEQEYKHSDTLPKMTPELLQDICKQRQMWMQPHLNTQLYLNNKGFLKIEGLEDYINIKSIHLGNNNIRKIEGLERMTQLRSLHLGGNRIVHLDNLGCHPDLRHLSLDGNAIRRVDNMRNLSKLETLDISANQVEQIKDLSELQALPALTNVDVSHNSIESVDDVVEFWSELQSLRVLRYHGNPGIRHIEHYRKRIINALPNLSYMDERPVFPVERKACQAWTEGGLPAMQEARKEFHRARHAECGVDPERRDMVTKRRQMAIERLDREAKEREEQEAKEKEARQQKAADSTLGVGKDAQAGDEGALQDYAQSWRQKVNLYGVEGVREKVAQEAGTQPRCSKVQTAESVSTHRDHPPSFEFTPPARCVGEESRVDVSSRRQPHTPVTIADFRQGSTDSNDLLVSAFGDGEEIPSISTKSKSSSSQAGRSQRANDASDADVMPLIWEQRQHEVAAAEAACLEQNLMASRSCRDDLTDLD